LAIRITAPRRILILGGALSALADDLDVFAGLAHGDDLLRIGFENDRRQHVAVVGVFGQRVVDGVFRVLGIGGQVHEFLRSAVDLAALVIHDALAQGPVRGVLLVGLHRGEHVQAAGVGFVPVLGVDQLADRFGDVLGVDLGVVAAAADMQFLLLGGFRFSRRDEAVVRHPLDDVLLARPGPTGSADRVVGGRRLRQAGEHRRLGDGQVLHRLAEVRFRRRGETIGAVAQEDLVHVDLQDLVLGEHVLQLERQQYFVQLAREGLLGRQVDIAGHLHRDRRCTLAFHPSQVGQRRPDQALVVDAAMRIEARVLDGQDGVHHHLGDVADRRQVAPLFAEFPHQHTLGGIDAQRQFWTVIRQIGDIGQVWVGNRKRDTYDGGNAEHGPEQQPAAPEEYAQQSAPPGQRRRLTRRRAGRIGGGIRGHRCPGKVPRRL
jgi:hypothetical protein